MVANTAMLTAALPNSAPQGGRLRRLWKLEEDGYVLTQAGTVLGGPYARIALVWGPTLAAPVRGRGRPRTRPLPGAGGDHAGQQPGGDSPTAALAALLAGTRLAAAPQVPSEAPGPAQLLLTAPPEAAAEYASQLRAQLQAIGHGERAGEVVLATGAFDPSEVNAALHNPSFASAFLEDWRAGMARQIELLDDEGDDLLQDEQDGQDLPSPRG